MKKNWAKIVSILGATLITTALTTLLAYAATETPQMPSTTERQTIENYVQEGNYEAFSLNYKEKTGEELSQQSFEKITKLFALKEQEKALIEELQADGVKIPMLHNKMEKGEFKTKLTDEQKATLEKAKTLKEEGKDDEAKQLLKDSGIKAPNKGFRDDHKKGMGMMEREEE